MNNFLTGVLATAIGVGLTFGVNNLVTHHRQAQAQRQTAMMAIYDIDDIIHHFIRYKERDDAFFKVAMYLYTHQDELENVAMDSLWMTGEYLFFYADADMPEWADNSTELVFSGSMDAMLNLGDPTFCDNVQKCYQLRRNMVSSMGKKSVFRRPLPEDFIFQYHKQLHESDLTYNGMMNQHAMAGLIRSAFQQQEVMLYLRKYLTRDRAFQEFINSLISLNQENKFIMNVTDEDMRKYEAEHVNRTVPAKAKTIVGHWTLRQDNQLKTYDFRKDYSVTATTRMDYRVGFALAPLTFSIDGQWQLGGDSLRLTFDTATVQLIDCDPAIEQHAQAARQQVQTNDWDLANKVLLDKSGKIMFWEQQYQLPWGQTNTEKTQLLKSH